MAGKKSSKNNIKVLTFLEERNPSLHTESVALQNEGTAFERVVLNFSNGSEDGVVQIKLKPCEAIGLRDALNFVYSTK